LLHSCAEMRAAIEVSFEVMSGVGPGIHVLDRVHVPQGEGAVLGIFFGNRNPIGLNGRNDVNVFDSCVKS